MSESWSTLARGAVPVEETPNTRFFIKVDCIFGMECQTTLLVQEEPISRLPVENYVAFGRILGPLAGYWAT